MRVLVGDRDGTPRRPGGLVRICTIREAL